MSQTEQKFDSLCAFADKLKVAIAIGIDQNKNTQIAIVGENIKYATEWTTTDQALTQALRYLRKISKTINK